MKQRILGSTGLEVSELCLGTMTWGNQTSEVDAHAQADLAVDSGLMFWDTAEMYPVNPVTAETAGHSEAIIGSWLAKRGGRSRLVLATKISGVGQAAVRNGAAITGATLRHAVEGSLRRMGTDYIDIYQLHWPNRDVYHFREIWRYDPRGEDRAGIESHMLDVLSTAADLIKEGKICHIALSNETVWGAGRWLALAERHGLPRMVSVQNEYSLLCRQFDSDWAEFGVREDMPLLGFSPLAAGILTGKYAGDVIPEGSRRARNHGMSGRITPQVFPAVAAYLGVAQRHGLDPVQMAIAFCLCRPFPIVPIIGATHLDQLKLELRSADIVLDVAVLNEIDVAHRAHPQPY